MLFAVLAAVACAGTGGWDTGVGACGGEGKTCTDCIWRTFGETCAWMVESQTCVQLFNPAVEEAWQADESSVKTKMTGCRVWDGDKWISARSIESRIAPLVTELSAPNGRKAARSLGCTEAQLAQSFGFGMYGTMTCQRFGDVYGRAACSMVSFTPCGCMCPGRKAARAVARLEGILDDLEQSRGARMPGMMRCMEDCYEEFGEEGSDAYGFREDGEPNDNLELFCWSKCQ